MKQDGDALQYASDELKNNKEVVLAAVKQDGGRSSMPGRTEEQQACLPP